MAFHAVPWVKRVQLIEGVSLVSKQYIERHDARGILFRGRPKRVMNALFGTGSVASAFFDSGPFRPMGKKPA